MAASGARECLSYLTNRIERLPSAALAAQQETAPQDIQAYQPVKNITGIALAEPERAFCVLEVQVAKPAVVVVAAFLSEPPQAAVTTSSPPSAMAKSRPRSPVMVPPLGCYRRRREPDTGVIL